MTRGAYVAAATAVSAVVAIVVILLVVSSRSQSGSQLVRLEPIPGARTGGDAAGDLVSAETVPQLDRSITSTGVKSARIVYHSTEGDTGTVTTVSGTVFVPGGDAPKAGWPVLAFAHGTTGINEPCAPSLSPDLLGSAAGVLLFTQMDYAVVLPDYQGLGEPGTHPYLDARTAGFNVIDGVRALRSTFPGISKRWAALGLSQGGGAAWSANEQAGTYAPELDLVGTSAVSPPADVSGLVKKAEDGTLTTDQGPALQAVLESLGRLHPDLDLDDYRDSAVARVWDTLSACSGAKLSQRDQAVTAIGRDGLKPRSAAAAAVVTDYLRDWSLPQKPLTAPMSVVYGGKDTLIDARWTTRALREACDLGGTVQFELQPSKGHADVDLPPQIEWIKDRFAGKEAPDGCTA